MYHLIIYAKNAAEMRKKWNVYAYRMSQKNIMEKLF